MLEIDCNIESAIFGGNVFIIYKCLKLKAGFILVDPIADQLRGASSTGQSKHIFKSDRIQIGIDISRSNELHKLLLAESVFQSWDPRFAWHVAIDWKAYILIGFVDDGDEAEVVLGEDGIIEYFWVGCYALEDVERFLIGDIEILLLYR